MNDNMFPFVELNKVMPLIKKAWDFQAKGYGTAFIDLSGHVCTLEIKLYVHGWAIGRDEDFSYQIRLSESPEEKWNRFNSDHVNQAISEIDELIEDLPTEQEVRDKNEAIKLESQRKQYEALKAKFESA